MKRIIRQGLFSSQAAPPRSWQSYSTSGAFHAVVITLLCLITFPVVKETAKPRERFTLLAPVPPVFKPKIVSPATQRPVLSKKEIIVANIVPKPVFIPPPVVKPPEPTPQLLAKAPELKEVTPIPVEHPPDAKLAPPKPEIHTGVFAASDPAKGVRTPHELKVGGFGDPNGLPPSSDPRPAPLTMARLGAFDMPNGAGHGGGGGPSQNGGVKAAGFGTGGDPTGIPGGPVAGAHGSVRTGGFGDGVAERGSPTPARSAEVAVTPVESYTSRNPLIPKRLAT